MLIREIVTMKRLILSAVTVAAIGFAAFNANAQSLDANALLDRMERLERDIRTLNIQIARGGGGTAEGGATGVASSGDPAHCAVRRTYGPT